MCASSSSNHLAFPFHQHDRVAVADRAIRNEFFPDAPCQIARAFIKRSCSEKPMGLGRPRLAMSRLAGEGPNRNIVPLS